MSADTMPCGCSGHADLVDECKYPELAKKYLELVKLAQRIDEEEDVWYNELQPHLDHADELEINRSEWDWSE